MRETHGKHSGRARLAAVAAGFALVTAACSPPPESPEEPPSCLGHAATLTGTAGADTLVGTRGPDVIAALGGDDIVEGRGGNDIICTGAGDDTVDGGAGGDLIELGDGADIAVGGRGADDLRGGPGGDAFMGGPGNDRIDGGGGTEHADLVAYLDADSGVVVNLATGVANGVGRDRLAGVEAVAGSPHPDALHGSAGVEFFFGLGGNDLMRGEGGVDFAMYSTAPAAVGVDLTAGVAVGGEGTDTIDGFEAVDGSPFDDFLVGDDADNHLFGGPGNDTANGEGGDNLCDAETTTNCTAPAPPTTPEAPGPLQSADIPELEPPEDPFAPVSPTPPATPPTGGALVGAGSGVAAVAALVDCCPTRRIGGVDCSYPQTAGANLPHWTGGLMFVQVHMRYGSAWRDAGFYPGLFRYGAAGHEELRTDIAGAGWSRTTGRLSYSHHRTQADGYFFWMWWSTDGVNWSYYPMGGCNPSYLPRGTPYYF